jgi:SSS family solute:Na+ symporter
MGDKQQLRAMRISIVVFAGIVLAYAIAMQGTSIYELVSSAYQVTLVGAFVPLVLGLYWKRSTTQGAIASIFAGVAVHLDAVLPPGEHLGRGFPGQLAGCWPLWRAWCSARWHRRCW